MSSEIPITVIIPTKNRAETLEHTLRTCTGQAYEKLTIIVSDNVSTDHTREIVEAANDARIRYINPGKSLSMAHHWEYALSHVQQGFVTVLGDDDGFLPGAIGEAARILEETKSKALATNYGLYWWPNVFEEERKNILHVSFRSGYERMRADRALQRLVEGKSHYLTVPCIYNSFIDRSLIDQAQALSGRFFRSQIPDVYSSIVLTGLLDEYVFSKKSLKVFGISQKSNGAAYLGKPGNDEVAKLFYQDETIPIHPSASNTLGKSIGIIMGECLLQSFDAGLNQSLKARFNWWPFLDIAVREANTTGRGHKDEIFRNIQEIIHKNHLNEREHEPAQRQNVSANAILSVVSRLKDMVAIVDASQYGAYTIQDACMLYNKIYQEPYKYPEIVPSTVSKLGDTAAFQSLKEFFNLRKK